MFILGTVVVVLVLLALFFLFRAMGRMGGRPSPQVRVRHSADDGHRRGPRASGIN